MPFRVSLIPLKIRPKDRAANLRHFEQEMARLTAYRPDLVCLPECAFTGYLCEPAELAELAEPIPGPTTQHVARLARQHNCYLCFGMLEKASLGFYSSAVLLDRFGTIKLVHRKIVEQPPFATGKEVRVVDTEFGRWSVLLCGDLFDDGVKARLRRRADLLLLPLARCFAERSPNLQRWLGEERAAYTREVAKLGLLTLMVNLLDDAPGPQAYFGGAMIVGPDGAILAEAPHGTDNVLVYDIPC
jgi:predicted amidohydrolase